VPAPSARVLRPELPRGVDAVIRKALAKSPADRYARAGDFAAALSDPAQLAAAAREAEAEARPLRRRLVPLLATIGVAAVAIALFLPPRRPVDANKVVVFPLGETPAGAQREGTGVVVALMIGNALAYTEPLEWIDGLPLLEARLHDDPAALTAREASQIARRAGARWYLDGTVVRQGDSATVVARLNDAVGDSVVGRASATRPTPEAAQAGLLAVNQILPRLLAPGQQMADLSVLSARRPAAVATWLQGEREYRRFNFPEALEYFRRAVDGDSALAVAALRGAQTASWLNQIGEAAALSGVAMRNLDLLPGRMADFARGLNAYVGGQADTAVFWLTRAIEANPQWTEAHMALGEVYYHLLPITTVPADSLAEVEFVAAAVDSGFSPARLHLAEIAILSGDTVRAEQAVDEFLRVAQNQASAPQRIMLQTMLDCARGGRKAVNWQRLAAAAPLDALRAAKMLSVGAAFPGCAEDGLRILFETPTLDLGYRWGAFLGLQGLLAAEGRVSELRLVVDSAVAHGLDLAVQLYVLDALAGVSLDADADAVAARTSEGDLGKAFPFSIWLAGEWHARRGDTVGVGTMQAALAEHAAATGRVADARLAAALAARRLLAEGDTAATLTALSVVLGGMRYDQLDWGVGESLAPERLLLAQLLLARGQTREALAAAAIFDHPTPVVFLPFLPASLTLRRDAARLLGQEHAVRQFEARLAALGRRVQLAGNGSTPSTSEAP